MEGDYWTRLHHEHRLNQRNLPLTLLSAYQLRTVWTEHQGPPPHLFDISFVGRTVSPPRLVQQSMGSICVPSEVFGLAIAASTNREVGIASFRWAPDAPRMLPVRHVDCERHSLLVSVELQGTFWALLAFCARTTTRQPQWSASDERTTVQV